jgi:protein-S-isoprenylcysteine O-methyltransferase Ste14
MLASMIMRSALGILGSALLLFLPAGTFAWPQGWVFLAIFTFCSFTIGLWLQRTDPRLLAARMASPLSPEQRPRDRAIIAAFMALFVVWVVFMPLDAKRFGWSHMPAWLEAVGAVLVVVSFWGNVGVLRANSFAAVNVLVQAERGQTVISTGPYAVVRHPMYAYALLLLLGIPLLLGSLWGLAWLPLLLALLVARLLGEEALLREGLAGYRDYAGRVRYRLIPGIW